MLRKSIRLNTPTTWITGALLMIGVAISFVSVLAQPYEPEVDKDPAIKFAKLDVKLDFGTHQQFYAYSGDPSKPGVLFIHGTPGGWEAFESYLNSAQLQRDFFLVSIDRLGWGSSPIPSKQINGDFTPQSQGIGAVLQQYPHKRWTLIGHSLGASIAPKVALDYPKQVSNLLLLAGSLKPSLGSPRWYNRAASTWVVASLIGTMMKHSNREIMGLRKQLKTMDAELKATKLDTNLVIMQGKKDRLVSPKNPAYVSQQWKDNFASLKIVELEDEGHFLPWRQPTKVLDLLYQLTDTSEPNQAVEPIEAADQSSL